MPKLNNVQCPAGMTLEAWQIALRQQQVKKENFTISQENEKYNPGVYRVGNPATRSEYKVVYRGKDSAWNFCSCFDFKTSQLGTCKHLEAVKMWTKDKRKKVYRDAPAYTSVYMDYKGSRRVRIRIGEDHQQEYEELAARYFDHNLVIKEETYAKFDIFLQKAKAIDENFRCYNDALDYIIEQRERIQRTQLIDTKYPDEILDNLLTVSIYPYQKEGIRFAYKAGKCIIADEMGLGKTIQAIATAEIFLREGLAESILIVCPTSLKYQWKREIEKFTGGDSIEDVDEYIEDGRVCPKVVVVEGNPPKREQLYKAKAPYKIVSYHAMANDVRLHGKIVTDVLIMDEIQRLKNWDTIISRAARKIQSRYAVLLSGTPLENKLEELYSTMELADQFCFGPYYKFRDEHILIDPDTGAVAGYKALNAVGEKASKRLLRRTKKGVQLQLPKRSDQYIIVPMTQEQVDYHGEFRLEVARIMQKYKKIHFMSEQDRKRLMLLLAQMRMVADSTFILEQNLKTRKDVKIAEVMNLLSNVFENGDEKVVIFSEWERMTRLVAMELDKRNIRYEYLNGSVPSKMRGELVQNFTTLPESRVFLSTDAGSTGLNLQVASILINLDLPWNPAVLEQRIARIYRLGQQNPVQILYLVSKESIEEGMIGKLKFKTSMFEGVLDGGDDMVFINEDKFKKFMDDIDSVIRETPEPAPIVEYIDEEESEEKTPVSDEPLTEDTATSSLTEKVQEHPDADISNTFPDTLVLSHDSSNIYNNESDETCQNPLEDDVLSHTSSVQNPSPASPATSTPLSSPRHPKQLISEGVSFLSGLAETLKSPEATKQLIDNIVDVNPETGETNLKIPVSSKETVTNVLQLFSKLFS
ncbi:MAG: DEAD/DEAH box helicase [Bacteroidales bacterium]|nr:DEAD/DEAH box helicase [Candidatus Physcousia equi]